MARGRMLNGTISLSIKFNRLTDDTCRLLATWCIPHLDHRGVFYADPEIVKGQVMPMHTSLTLERIEHYLLDMQRVGLVMLFTFDERRWMYWPGFSHNQTIRAGKERSRFPPPPVDGQQCDETKKDGSPPTDGPRADNGQPADGPRAKTSLGNEMKGNEMNTTAPERADVIDSEHNAPTTNETEPPSYSAPSIAQTDVRRPGTTFDAFYGKAFEQAANPGEQVVRGWCLAQHIEDLSIEFVRLTGITPKDGKRGDKGLYAADALEWLTAGYTVADMKEAYGLAQGKFTVTHLGALFRKTQELRAQRPAPVSAAIEDAMTTPNGKVVNHVR